MESGLDAYRRSVGEAKRAAILKAAREVFLKNGYSSTAVTEIARRADVSTATLYKHFASKEELFVAAVESAAEVIINEFPLEPMEATLLDKFCLAARLYLSMQFDHGMNDLLRVIIAEAPPNPHLTRRIFDEVVERRRMRVAAILDFLVARGDLKPHDTGLSAAFLGGMMKEIFVWPVLFDPEVKIPENADGLIRETMAVFLARYGA